MTRFEFLDPVFTGRLCMTLVHSMWQVALFAAMAWAIERLGRRRSVQSSYAVHMAALLAALAAMPMTYALVDGGVPDAPARSNFTVNATFSTPPPVVLKTEGPGFFVGQGEPAPTADNPATSPNAHAPAPVTIAAEEPSARWPRVASWIVSSYAIGALLMLVRLIRGTWYAHRLASGAQLIADGVLVERLDSLARKWSMRMVPALARAEEVLVPKIVGLVRPTILLPVSAITCLSTEELELILAHELAHVRRYDMWVNLAQRVAEVVLFFNPALWYLSRRISTLREYCCDELTCRATSGSDAELRTCYAGALLRIVELSRQGAGGHIDAQTLEKGDLAALASAGRSPSELRRRVARLFGEPLHEPVRLTRGGLITLAVVTAFLLTGPTAWHSIADSAAAPPTDVIEESTVASVEGGTKNEADLDRILADWKTRREMVDTIRYIGEGTVTVPKGAFNRDLPEDAPEGVNMPAEDYTFPVEYDWMIDFKNGRMCRKTKRQVFHHPRRQFIPDVTIEVCDGQVRRRWEPLSENTSETHAPGVGQPEITDNLHTAVRTEDFAVFLAHGYFCPSSNPHKTGLFKWPIDRADFTIVGEKEHNGRRCVILRRAPGSPEPGFGPSHAYDEFWVDPRRDSAVVRWTRQTQWGQVAQSMELEYESVEGFWLPKEMSFDQYQGWTPKEVRDLHLGRPSDILLNSMKLKLVRGDPNGPIRLESFQIKPKEGMLIEDQQTGERYRHGATRETDAKIFRGTVLDQSGNSVADADVWLSMYWRPDRGRPGARVQHVKSDSRGQFTLKIPSAWVARQVADSPVTIWAYSPGYQLGIKHAKPVTTFSFGEDASNLAIRLKPATDLSFTVLDPTGQPLAGALVQPLYVTLEPTPKEVLRRIEARTDATGRATFPAVGRQELSELRISAEGFGIQMQRYSDPEYPLPAENTIRLRPVGRIEGQLIADKPEWARGVRLTLVTEKLVGRAPPWLTEGFAEIESDEQGRFVVPRIAGGRLGFRSVAVDEQHAVGLQLPQFVDLEADVTNVLQIPVIPLVPVQGTVRVKDSGVPVSDARVYISPGDGGQTVRAVSDSQGRFTGQALPGRVSLTVFDRSHKYVQLAGAASHEIPKQIEEFKLPPIEVVPAKIITGRVIDERDQPVANAIVSCLVGDRHPYGNGKSDANGRFEVLGVPATLDTAAAEYVVQGSDPLRRLLKSKVIKTDPLIIRVQTH